MDQRRSSLSEREKKQLRALLRRRKREEEGLFLAEGVRVVEDLLASSVRTSWVLTSSSLEDSVRGAALVRRIFELGLPLRTIGAADFLKVAPTEHSQGVLAIAEVPAESWTVVDRQAEKGVVLLLDGIQDPGNLGTLARTAEALGVQALIALPGTVDPWNAKAVRAAAGSLFRLPILESDWPESAERLRAAGYRILVADVGGDPPASGADRVALVVGNEGAGISAAVLHDADGTVGIPLAGRAESLNVAAAAAILLYELTRQQ